MAPKLAGLGTAQSAEDAPSLAVGLKKNLTKKLLLSRPDIVVSLCLSRSEIVRASSRVSN